MKPAINAQDSHTRSRRRGFRNNEPIAATPTTMPTTEVNTRFQNSIRPWNDAGATNEVAVHFGQSGQPRPDEVSRTAAPLTTIRPSRTATTTANLRNAEGDSWGSRI